MLIIFILGMLVLRGRVSLSSCTGVLGVICKAPESPFRDVLLLPLATESTKTGGNEQNHYELHKPWYEAFHHADYPSEISAFQISSCSAWLLQVQLRKAAHLHGWQQFIPAARPVSASPLEICSGNLLETKASGCAWLVRDLSHVLSTGS